MDALETFAVVLLMALPVWCLARREISRLTDPGYLRAHGLVIVSERALQGHSASIGEYLGHPIWASVRFMGMEYRFDHVLDPLVRERIAARELYIDPGLVYVTD